MEEKIVRTCPECGAVIGNKWIGKCRDCGMTKSLTGSGLCGMCMCNRSEAKALADAEQQFKDRMELRELRKKTPVKK